uniref:Uncharacterized protein n=1 Tax=Acrobeloides nanus TaxID=290746 RepID=A0A914DCZ4_9BILA
MNNSQLKILLSVVMLIVTLIFGFLPIKVYSLLEDKKRQTLLQNRTPRKWPSILISSLTSFAGGVFLGIIFLDMLPAAQNALQDLHNKGAWKLDYPIIELICLLGFFIVYAIEELSVKICHAGHGHSHAHHDQTLVTKNPKIFEMRVHSHSHNASQSNDGESTTTAASDCEIHGLKAHHESKEEDVELHKITSRRAVVKSLTFVLALLFHSAIEGFAFGIQSSEFTVLTLFFGIIVHKSVVAFSVGMRLIRCHPDNNCLVILFILLIAITSPIMSIIGVIIQDAQMNDLAKDKISTILTSASMGTFLYISFFEVSIFEYYSLCVYRC